MITLDSVSMAYRGGGDGQQLLALADVSLTVGENEFVTIVGRSGCGKSTLLKLIAGLLLPTTGRVALRGREIAGPHRDVGLVFQQPVLLKWRTVLQNVLLPIEYLKLPKREYRAQALELLELVGLKGFEHVYPRQLSGGMQQRAALARALIYDPTVLLMDEPFAALDAMTREEMSVELLRIWEERRKSVVFVTHSISEAVLLSDRVVVLSDRPGRISKVIQVGLRRPRVPEVEMTTEFADYVHEIKRVIYSH